MTDTQQSTCVINEEKSVEYDKNVRINDEEKPVDHDNNVRIDKDKPVPVDCDWRLEEGGGPTERTWSNETIAFNAEEEEDAENPTLLDRLPFVFATIIFALIFTGFVLTHKL